MSSSLCLIISYFLSLTLRAFSLSVSYTTLCLPFSLAFFSLNLSIRPSICLCLFFLSLPLYFTISRHPISPSLPLFNFVFCCFPLFAFQPFYQMLPPTVAQALQLKKAVTAETYESVTVSTTPFPFLIFLEATVPSGLLF